MRNDERPTNLRVRYYLIQRRNNNVSRKDFHSVTHFFVKPS